MQRRIDDAGTNTVELVLILPALALLLGAMGHLGLHFTVRQAAVTGAQQGLVVATSGDLDAGREEAIDTVERFSTGEVVLATVTRASPISLTVTLTVRSPGVVPGLPRTFTVVQTGVEERFLEDQ